MWQTWLHFQHHRHTAWRLEREARQQKEIADTLFEHLQMDGINEILCLMIWQTTSSSTTYFTAPSTTPPLFPPHPNNPVLPTDDSMSLATPSSPSSSFEEGTNIQRPIIIFDESSSSESPIPSPPLSSSLSSLRKRAGSPLTAVARIFCMSRKWDVKLQILPVSMETLLIKDFAQCKLTCKTWLSFSFCVLQPCKISWPQQWLLQWRWGLRNVWSMVTGSSTS